MVALDAEPQRAARDVAMVGDLKPGRQRHVLPVEANDMEAAPALTQDLDPWRTIFASRATLLVKPEVLRLRSEATTVSGEPRVRASEAMNRYASGDDAAFSELYESLAPRLYGFILRLTGERSAAEDLLQQTFLQMHDARARFVRGADVTPWAMAIARRLFIDSLRRARSRATDLVDAVILDETNAGGEASPEDWLMAREAEAIIAARLATLPASHRDAFQLVKQEGLSIAEAAAILGVTGAAVKLRAFRAYSKLRAALEPASKVR
jgi:RNA polymerase sigma-70 factor (ECF subfamily)